MPEIVTVVFVAPDCGEVLLMQGADDETAKHTPLLACPFTNTVTGPVTVPEGTCATKLVFVQVVGKMPPLTGSVAPLKNTRLLPIVVPKLEPLKVTLVPAAPDVGDMLVIDGAEFAPLTVKATPLLA
jgi:hypothetical protein